MTEISTKVEQIELENLDFLTQPGAEAVLIAEEKPKTIFTRESAEPIDLSAEPKKEPAKNPAETAPTATVAETVTELTTIEDPEKEVVETKQMSSSLAKMINELIEAKQLVPFDDDKKIEEYSEEDVKELILANFKAKEEEIKNETPKEFFKALPPEMQYAAKYISDGGTDLKALFKVLSAVEETRSLNVEDPGDQETIAREFLRSTRSLTEEEIADEIETYKDTNKLEAKAKQYKPKLDNLNESRVAQKLAEQERTKALRQEAAQTYTENVYKTLAPGELNGIKLDKKTQSMLYNGLVNATYPSSSGRSTNMLGHLLEKYQFVEPNPALISEALWLLADPDGYKAKIAEIGKATQSEKIVRALKTEQSAKTISTEQSGLSEKGKPGLIRPRNIFKRT